MKMRYFVVRSESYGTTDEPVINWVVCDRSNRNRPAPTEENPYYGIAFKSRSAARAKCRELNTIKVTP